ncbi:MAG: hypothetical protein IPJ65_08710 [Archangiaceae bacterium]|nr:hypothetical protein [Archangiaceae bacterium]
MRLALRSLFVCTLLSLAACDCNEPPPGTDGGGSGGSSAGGGTGGNTGGGDAGGGGIGGGGGTGGTGAGLADGGMGCGLTTCASANANCGPIGDGCGNIIDCGGCPLPATCGGGGTPSQCGGDANCIARTCQQIGAECGPMSDGCGGLLNCGACTQPETCGGGGINNRCGVPGTVFGDGGACVGITCATAGASCGVIGDGCGNIVMCGGCDAGQFCGGGGVPYKCGGGNSCTALTCAKVDAGCGAVGDGCGNILNCGMCSPPFTCGGGGQPNQCGGGVTCVARTCAQADAGCGQVGDGCGGVTASCGTCATGQCGAGGVPNQCGGSSLCTARTCASLGVNCGAVGDGCGSVIQCGACTDGGTCGGGMVANVCGGAPPCVAKTCAQQGANCGPVSDGCGGLTPNCGSCDGGEICGGNGTPSVCGAPPFDAGACVNLCLNQAACTPTTKTKFSGTVFAPTQADAGYGNPDPIPGALIYVPNTNVQPFSDGGVTCDQCTDGVSGSPLVSTTSAIDGTFTLDNVPCGAGVNVPVVIQLGKWRRQITVPNPSCCQNNVLTQEQTRLPRKQGEGNANDNIPLMAVVTGNADLIECVLPKIGIAPSEFSNPAGNGRVRFYRDNGAWFDGGTLGASPPAATLFDSLAEMKKYDVIVLDCVGGEQVKTMTRRANLEAYVNAGGRVFASHFAYVWLFNHALDPNGNNVTNNISFTSTATWNPQQASPPNQDAYVDVSFPKGSQFGQWIQLVNAQATSSTPLTPRIRVLTVRHDMDAVNAPAQRWVYGTATTPTCQRAACSDLGYTCGNPVQDGCGTTRNCGGCNGGQTCGGGGTPGTCGTGGTCVPKTCAQLGYECGTFGNGCGGTITCTRAGGASCPAPQICGGGGQVGRCGGPAAIPLQYTFNAPTSAAPALQCGRVLFSDFHVIDTAGSSNITWPNQCSVGSMNAQEKVFEYLLFDLSSCITPDVPPSAMCTPRTCAQQNLQCGLAADGCGGQLNCGPCTLPQTCGGAGVPGQCGVPCTPRTCAQLGATCGVQGDGCGGTANPDGGACGTCTPPQTCGGGGTPNVCGGGTCVTKTCGQLGFNCGTQTNGCNGTQNCGTCTPPMTCGGGGQPGVCGGGMMCTPLSCAAQGFNCGMQGDGCGNTQNCGNCTPPMTCGGGGQPGVCGGGMMCTPKSCLQQGFQCGLQGDGCGNQIDCGPCPPGQTCGTAGPGRCGANMCTPLTCAGQGFNCGFAGDGCGNLLQCGVCTPPMTCGGGGTPGQCGMPNCTPRTCQSAGANCGALADGCGGILQCGDCIMPQTCGGGGVANVCGGIG